SDGHVELTPVQTSSGSQASPEPARHTVPAFPAGCWHALLVPSQASVVHGFPSLEHAVPDGLLASAGQLALVPVQLSAGSHSPADERHWVNAGRKPSTGHVELVPVHVSTASHAPAAARQTAPAFPAGCWHASLLPSHASVVHGLPSSVHAVPLAFLASAGQAALLPVHVSATSHPPPAAARHVVPELPGACWQTPLDPLQRSVVQTLPSSVQAVPLVLNVHVVVQHEAGLPLSAPVSHCSGLSTTPSPQSEK